jgi:hypothetical protein
MKTSVAFTGRLFLLRLAVAAVVVLCFAVVSRAGGPRYVAGTSFFDGSTTGRPVAWPQGIITYYTDQGDLSAFLPNATANSFVAGAFSVWTSVPTAALAASSAGELAEDVNGSNVTVNGDGTISMPLDIQPTATGASIGIVYDADGSVTDALLGAGAGGSGECFFNAVVGGADNFGAFATIEHALIVINGQCAQQGSQLTDLEYRLVRVIGGVLGLGWSQVNGNVQAGSPHASSEDYAGFPVMHYVDAMNCAPITFCYANPYQLSMDDVAAVSRLYPVTAQNVSSFPGKQVFASTTARIQGAVWFTDTHGSRTQPMQGVNVVARWIDPSTGKPSRRYAASSVSGFLFTGNAGNPITGYVDPVGYASASWGSNNTTVEGYFDLAGLQLPLGGSAQYQISVEPIDRTWSGEVGPYSPGPVAPSGTATPITVTVTAGSDVMQDILMSGTAQPLAEASSSWSAPAALPPGGDWISSLNHYGNVSYFTLNAQKNRTLSVSVTALDESGRANTSKAQPVIGMWSAADPEGTAPPAFTPSPFNQVPLGLTRLDAQVLTGGRFLIGIGDVRGDGRPDYRYHARVLYGDTVSPARVSVNGGPVTVSGFGFAPGLSATVGSASATQMAISASGILVQAPAHADGTQTITITDPVGGGSTSMTDVLTYGAAATDTIVLVAGSNPATPVGAQAAHPVTVRVLAADGVTPVSGATVAWNATNGLKLSACGGASSCSVMSNQYGDASTWVTPAAAGMATITATLAPATYALPKSVITSVTATQSGSDIGLTSPYLWVSQGATASIPLTVRALSNGTARSNVQVNFTLAGSGTLSAANAVTNATGYATITLMLTQFTSLAQVVACVAPNNAPCGTFYVNPVPLSQQRLLQISGAGQMTTGAFQPVTVQVVDSSTPPNAVVAAPVVFQTTVLRAGGMSIGTGDGESNPGNPAMPVILSVSQSSALTDLNGLASILPSSGGFSAPLEVDVMAWAGTTGFIDDPLQLLPEIDAASRATLTTFHQRPVWLGVASEGPPSRTKRGKGGATRGKILNGSE